MTHDSDLWRCACNEVCGGVQDTAALPLHPESDCYGLSILARTCRTSPWQHEPSSRLSKSSETRTFLPRRLVQARAPSRSQSGSMAGLPHTCAPTSHVPRIPPHLGRPTPFLGRTANCKNCSPSVVTTAQLVLGLRSWGGEGALWKVLLQLSGSWWSCQDECHGQGFVPRVVTARMLESTESTCSLAVNLQWTRRWWELWSVFQEKKERHRRRRVRSYQELVGLRGHAQLKVLPQPAVQNRTLAAQACTAGTASPIGVQFGFRTVEI